MKARFTEKPQAVVVIQDGNTIYCQVAINVTEIEIADEITEEKHTEYEADFNQFSVQKGEIDLDDLNRNPSAYIDYKPRKIEDTEKRINDAIALAVAALI